MYKYVSRRLGVMKECLGSRSYVLVDCESSVGFIAMFHRL